MVLNTANDLKSQAVKEAATGVTDEQIEKIADKVADRLLERLTPLFKVSPIDVVEPAGDDTADQAADPNVDQTVKYIASKRRGAKDAADGDSGE